MSHILFLTQVLPYPLDAGAKIRAYYVLRHLASQHEVTLVSFVRSDDRPEYTAHLETFCRAVHTVPMQRSWARDARALLVSISTGQPAVIVRDEIPEMHTTLQRLIENNAFDVVHADQTSMAQYALYSKRINIQTFKRSNVQAILDAHNALYRIPERLAAHERNPLKRLFLQRETHALSRYEADLLQRFDHVVFVTDVDRIALQKQLSKARPQLPTPTQSPTPQFPTIPICVDPKEKRLVERLPHPLTITHLGTMFWPPNVEGVLWFAQEVFPRVLDQVPDARFVIMGKDPPQQVQDLPLRIRNVQVTGYVRDPAPYLAETAVFLVPLHAAGGMRVKILDAWCWGVPIVSTTIGAEGIDVQDGENILIGDTPKELAEAVSRVLQNPALGRHLRENGRRWVERHYAWQQVYGQWDQVYEQLVVPTHTT